MYKVTEYLGDYPLDNQTMWDEEFRSLKAAEKVAICVYGNGYEGESKPGAELDAMDYYILIEKINPDGSGIDTPITALHDGDFLTGQELEDFLKKYE